MKADDFLADVPSADDFLGEPDPRKPRRDRIRSPYVAADNPANPIIPTGGSVLQDVQMPVPTFDQNRRDVARTNAAIAANTPAPRGPRPQRDMKAVAQDIYSILGNTAVQLVKPFVDVPNIFLGGALDPAVRFLQNAGQAANEAASPTTNYDRETLANIPEGQTLEKAATLISNPGLAANMGIPSAASMVMPRAFAKGAAILAPRSAAALGDKFATGTAVAANSLMNAGDTFGQTESDIPGRLLAALGSGAASALVGKATGGGLEGQLARGGGVPTVGAALRSVGNDSVQEFGENVGNQFAQDTGEGKPLNVGKALDEGTIGALLAPFVSGPVNLAQVAGSPQRRNANLLAGAIEADSNSMPARPDVMDNSMRAQPAPAPERAVTPATPAPIPQLPYDPTVQNPQRPVVVDQQGNARTMSADEFLAADETRQGAQELGLTPDVRRAQETRSTPAEPDPIPSDLLQRLRDSGWTPPQERPQPKADSVEFPDPVKPRPLTVDRGMEILDAGKSRALLPQERGYLDELKKQIGQEDFQLLQDSVQQPFKVSMADRKFRVPKITDANRGAVSTWDQANAPKSPAAEQQQLPISTPSPAAPRGVTEPTPISAARPVAANEPASAPTSRSEVAPASRRAMEETLLTEGKTQTRYMGNKREFFQQNARFIARDVAPLTQQADTLFDMYAGGGTYGLTIALSGVMPNVKRVVVNEVDPVRAARFRLASERGGEIMRPWETDPKLQELAAQLRPLIGKSSTPAALAMAAYQGQSGSQKYAQFKAMRKKHGAQSEESSVARLALYDVFFSGRTASWERLMKNAAQDADRIRELAQRARERGIAVEVTSHDSLGREAVDMVRSKGGNAVVMLDPPYHTTSSGAYSAGDKQFDFASDDFLQANVEAGRQMADGNVVLYNNKDTPLVRKNFSDGFGGSMVARGWKRQNGQREFLGVYDGRGKSGDAGLRVGGTGRRVGDGTADKPGEVLDRTGSNPGGPAQTGAPSTVRGTQDQAATASGARAADDGPAGARRAVGRLSKSEEPERISQSGPKPSIAKGMDASRHSALLREWYGNDAERVASSIARNIRARADTRKFDYELRDVPVDEITPSQTGEDYTNDSSEYTAKQIATKPLEDFHRREDVLPILLDGNGKIMDGNHRHAASAMNKAATIPALVPVKPGTGEVVNIEAYMGGKLSRPNPRAAGATIDTLRTALTDRFGSLIDKMEARGFLKLWPSTQAFNDGQQSEKIEGPVQGYWDGKTAHLFADGIEPGNEVAVLLHEVGEHASMKKMLGAEAYSKLVERAYDLVDAEDPTAMRAIDRIPDDTPDHYKDSEFLAYMIETVAADGARAAPSARKWLADVVAAIRAWFSQTGLNKVLDRYGKGIELTPADIAALAVRAVRWQAGQDGGAAGGGQASKAQDQTQTAAFKAWFGDSKVVDGQGKPLVVYHGTTADLSAFDLAFSGSDGVAYSSPAIFATDDSRVASDYARNKRNRNIADAGRAFQRFKNENPGLYNEEYERLFDAYKAAGRKEGWDIGTGANVLPLYLSIQNPLEVDGGGQRFMQVMPDAVKQATADGRDGVIVRNVIDHASPASEYPATVYVAFRPEQIKSAIGNRGTFDGGNPDIRYSRPARPSTAAAAVANVFGGTPNAPTTQTNAMPWAVTDPGRLDDFIRYIQNSRIDIKRTVDAVKAAGQHVADDANPYLMDELYIGKVRAQLDHLADESIKPLLSAIANSGFKTDQVNEYLWARHAEERNRQMAKVNAVPFTPALDLAGMSTTDANTKLAAYRAMPDFRKLQAIVKMVDQITEDARTKIVTDGLEEPGVIQAWEGAYKHYVPLQRDMEEAGGKASGYNVKGSESRRAVGSKKEAINILANVIAQAEATIIRSEKAAVGRSVLDMARQHPNPDFWTVDTPPTERVIDPRTGLVTNRVKPNYKALDNVFTVKEAGVEHFVTFNDGNARAVQFARTLKNMDAANMGPVLDAIGKATRYLAQWVTSRNPLFWMTNFARDVQGVAFNLQSTPLKGQAPQVMANIPQALGGFARLNAGKTSGKWTTLAQEFKDAGGQTGYMDQYRDSVERMDEIVKEVGRLQQSNIDPRKIGRAVLDVLEAANDTIENGVRLAVYAQAREEGISQAQAASIAKNISVNFNRKGNASGVYNALFMFFNANVQGNVRMIQGVMQSRRAQGYAAALTMAGAAVALLNLAGGGEDDATKKKRYELVPEWERERNWIVFIPGTDRYVKIPLPLGPHVLFNAGRILAEIGFEDGADPVEKAASFVSSMFSAFNPVGGGFPSPDAKGAAQLVTPTIARPVVDLVVNQNFAGTPIARENNFPGYKKPNYLAGRESTAQYWSSAAKALNDWTGGDNVKPGKINLSPEQLAYLVKGYVVPGVAQTVDTVAKQAMAPKDTPAEQMIGVSKFFGKIDDRARTRAAYEKLREDEQRLGEYKNYISAGEREKAREVLSDWGGGSEANGRKLLSQYTVTDRLLASIRKQKRTIAEHGDPDAQVQKLEDMNDRVNRTLAVYLANTRDLRRKTARQE